MKKKKVKNNKWGFKSVSDFKYKYEYKKNSRDNSKRTYRGRV